MKYLSYISFLILSCYLFSCSEDLDVKPGLLEPGDDLLQIELILPEVEHIVTRSNDTEPERKINNLSILLCDSENTLIKEIKTDPVLSDIQLGFNSESRSYIYQVALTSEEKESVREGKVYAVANTILSESDDLLNKLIGTDKKLDFSVTSANLKDKDGAFLMSGVMDPSSRVLPLVRTGAKITLTNEADNAEVIGWQIYNVAAKGYLMADVLKKESQTWYYNTINSPDQTIDNTINIGEAISTPETFEYLVAPTQTHIGLKVYTYIIIYAQYEGQEYYYAVPLYNSDKKADDTQEYYYDIEPNHWYDLRIKKVIKEGWRDPEEAVANHNDNQIWVEIHDHAPDVFSMVTDGIHELGVTRYISLNKSSPTAILKVKCYAADVDLLSTENLKDLYNSEIKFETADGDKWIDIIVEEDYPKVVINDQLGGTSPDLDNPGLQIEYKIGVKNDFVYSEQTGTLYVRWKGLERAVTVSYDPEVEISSICSVDLRIIDTDNSETYYRINKYWDFIKGNGTQTTQDGATPKLWGITSEVLAGNSQRTNGFHFPMPYGYNYKTSPWEYEYDIDFTPILQQSSRSGISDVKASLAGDSFITSYIEFTYNNNNKGTLKLKDGGKTSYQYAGGTITFTVSFNTGDPIDIKLSLYHTGFFHFDGNSDYCPTEDIGYYYYEVVPVTEGGMTYYWLDRNLGAKSNMMFVNNETQRGYGNPLACGRYYKVANYNQYSDPMIVQAMCPPGYHIPATGEWDKLRLSANFTTGSETYNTTESFTTTYYETGNIKIGKVYFPRTRYYNNQGGEDNKYQIDANNGDASVGYYWTVTPAPGMEKLDMGKWLRALYLNGEASTYMNINIEESKMNVRCLAGSKAADQDNHYVSFNVHNATHVYLFDEETKSALYTFPGKALASAQSSEQWQYFNCTTAYPIDNLLVLFVKVDSNGKLTLYTKDGEKFSTEKTFSQDILNSKYAWEVERGYYYDFCDTALTRVDPSVTSEEPDECDAPAENSGSGSGGNTGGDNTNKGGNETQRGPETTPQCPPEIIIWQGSVHVSWNETDINYDMWKFVPEGSKLRIYGNSSGSSPMVGIRGKNWNNYLGTNDDYFQYNEVDGYVEIELTAALLNEIISKGMMFTGQDFNVTYITIILEGGEFIKPEPIKGNYDWSGWYQDQGNYWTVLGDGLYDWSSVTPGSTLTFSNMDVWYAGDAWIKLYTSDDTNNMLGQYWVNATLKNCVITLTQDQINKLVSGNGLYVKVNQIGFREFSLRIK